MVVGVERGEAQGRGIERCHKSILKCRSSCVKSEAHPFRQRSHAIG
jgi:hypothetical protein